MSILCKPPEVLSFTENVAQNWRDFEEQLQWFLEGTESTEKGDKAKIGIMLSYADKEAQEIYKTLPWTADGDKKQIPESVKSLSELLLTLHEHYLQEIHILEPSARRGESIVAYLTRLKVKIDSCEYSKEG